MPTPAGTDAPAAAPWASGTRSSRANNFDALRLLLAVGVILSHAYPVTRGDPEMGPLATEPVVVWTHGQTSLGSLCVHAFFAISGYLVAASWQNCRTAGDYFGRRSRRVVPGYLLAVAVSLGVAAWAGADLRATPVDVARRVANVVLMQHVRVPTAMSHNPTPGVVNASLWTIQYEAYCYVLLASAGSWVVRRRCGRLTAAVCGLSLAAAAVSAGWWTRDFGYVGVVVGKPTQWPRLASHFFAGVLFYVVRDRVPARPAFVLAATAAWVAGARVPPVLAVVSPFALTYVLLWLAYCPGIRLHAFGRWGDFSYGTYLYGFPIQQALVYTGVARTVTTNVALAVPLSLAAGVASWHACEKWFAHSRRAGRRPDATRTATAGRA